jgi:hypothetical protein
LFGEHSLQLAPRWWLRELQGAAAARRARKQAHKTDGLWLAHFSFFEKIIKYAMAQGGQFER